MEDLPCEGVGHSVQGGMNTDGYRWEICKFFAVDNAHRPFYSDYFQGKLKSKRNILASFRIGQKIKYQSSVFIVPYRCLSVVISYSTFNRGATLEAIA